jgi:hypothetical protein
MISIGKMMEVPMTPAMAPQTNFVERLDFSLLIKFDSKRKQQMTSRFERVRDWIILILQLLIQLLLPNGRNFVIFNSLGELSVHQQEQFLERQSQELQEKLDHQRKLVKYYDQRVKTGLFLKWYHCWNFELHYASAKKYLGQLLGIKDKQLNLKKQLQKQEIQFELGSVAIFHSLTNFTLDNRNDSFKSKLCRYFDRDEEDMIWCMLIGIRFPDNLVEPTYLFHKSNHHLSKLLLDFEDLHDPMNGLLLFKPLQKAYYEFAISFVLNKDGSTLCLRVNNPSYRKMHLIRLLEPAELEMLGFDLSTLPVNWRELVGEMYSPETEFNLLTTFGDLEGTELELELESERIHTKALHLQSNLAYLIGSKQTWFNPGELEEFRNYNRKLWMLPHLSI